MKAHAGVDADSGLVHNVATTAGIVGETALWEFTGEHF